MFEYLISPENPNETLLYIAVTIKENTINLYYRPLTKYTGLWGSMQDLPILGHIINMAQTFSMLEDSRSFMRSYKYHVSGSIGHAEDADHSTWHSTHFLGNRIIKQNRRQMISQILRRQPCNLSLAKFDCHGTRKHVIPARE